jgi:hypothetical protein
MRNLFLLLALVLPCQAAHVIFNFEDFTADPQKVRTFELYPIGSFTNGAGNMITRDRRVVPTGTNGSVTISNIYGWVYRGEFRGTYTTTTNYFNFPVTNGVINASHYLTNPITFFTSQSADSRFVNVAGDTMTGALVISNTLTVRSNVTVSGATSLQDVSAEDGSFSGPVSIQGVLVVNSNIVAGGSGVFYGNAGGASNAVDLIAGSNITITTNANNRSFTIASSGGGGGSQTPWTSDINAAQFSLTNAGTVSGTNLVASSNIIASGLGRFVGNGIGVTNISADNLASGTVPLARLAGVATNTYTPAFTFSNTMTFANPSAAAGSFENLQVGGSGFTNRWYAWNGYNIMVQGNNGFLIEATNGQNMVFKNGALTVPASVTATTLVAGAEQLKGVGWPSIQHYGVPFPPLAYVTWQDGSECEAITNGYMTHTMQTNILGHTSWTNLANIWGSSTIHFLDGGSGWYAYDANGALQLNLTNFPGVNSMRRLADACHTNAYPREFGVYININQSIGIQCIDPAINTADEIYATIQALLTAQVDWVKLDSPNDDTEALRCLRWMNDALNKYQYLSPRRLKILFTDYEYSSNPTYQQENPQVASMANILQTAQGGGGPSVWSPYHNWTNTMSRYWVQRPGVYFSPTVMWPRDPGWSTETVKHYLTMAAIHQNYIQVSDRDPTNALAYLTNREMIAIVRDVNGIPGTNWTAIENNSKHFWVKPLGADLGANSNAIAFLNLFTTNYTFTLQATNFASTATPWTSNTLMLVRDVWGKTNYGVFSNLFQYTVPASNSALLVVYRVPMHFADGLTGPTNITINSSGKEIVIRQTGDVDGPTSFTLAAHAPIDGAQITLENYDFAGLALKGSSSAVTLLKQERRGASLMDARNSPTGEFQIVNDAGSGAYVVGYFGASGSGVRISDFRLDSNLISTNGSILLTNGSVVTSNLIVSGVQTNTTLAGSGVRYVQVDDNGKLAAINSTNSAGGASVQTSYTEYTLDPASTSSRYFAFVPSGNGSDQSSPNATMMYFPRTTILTNLYMAVSSSSAQLSTTNFFVVFCTNASPASVTDTALFLNMLGTYTVTNSGTASVTVPAGSYGCFRYTNSVGDIAAKTYAITVDHYRP